MGGSVSHSGTQPTTQGHNKHYLGTVATVTCNEGYAVNDSTTATCQSDHTWTVVLECRKFTFVD